MARGLAIGLVLVLAQTIVPATGSVASSFDLVATVTGATTLPPGGSSSMKVTYAKNGTNVPTATLTLQRLTSGTWNDAANVTITRGSGQRALRPKTTTTYRLRNYNSSAVTAPFTIKVASSFDLVATVTGATTLPPGGSSSMKVTYAKNGTNVPTATLTLQRLTSGTWNDAANVTITRGSGQRALRPKTTTTYRLRNYNSSAVTAPFTIKVAAPADSTRTVASRHSSLPDGRSVGVPVGRDLTRSGATSIAPSRTTIKDMHYTGDLRVTGQDVTLQNVLVDGEVVIRGSSRVTVIDSSVGAFSISGSTDVTARRLDVFGSLGRDGLHITSDSGRSARVLVEDSRIHSPQVTATSHYDGVQVRGVDDLTLRGNSFELGPHRELHQLNAAVFLQEANGGNTAVLVTENWIDGGGYSMYLSGKDVTVARNRFGDNHRWGLLYPASNLSSVNLVDNVSLRTGAPALP
ncbi:right-handed parallel beta-helix repeat-containing protein [Actinotalea sp. C106]|uniref:right-handed parallel beta-helix repeat-containing protein n=1 Tax=Actinotalea sp. C106 TaxID=2908644 RepID=UPI0020286648|nr:right-handed parallel beta-helix repeat-containing protein [Actinotalea sp. C106]